MHPRETPKRAQSRRKAQPGLGHDHGGSRPSQAAGPAQAGPAVWLSPGETLQRRVGPFWGLTLGHEGALAVPGAGVPKGAGGVLRRLPRQKPGLRAAPTPAPLATPARVHPIASQPLVAATQGDPQQAALVGTVATMRVARIGPGGISAASQAGITGASRRFM